jgi:hypothetical protein
LLSFSALEIIITFSLFRFGFFSAAFKALAHLLSSIFSYLNSELNFFDHFFELTGDGNPRQLIAIIIKYII